MKKIAVLLLFLNGIYLNAQIGLGNVSSPGNPAFNILGIEPQSIARPSSPSAFASQLVPILYSGTLPAAMALEATPYWWTDHPITLSDYYSNNIGLNMRSSFSFSLATNTIKGNEKGRDLGIGLTTQLIHGRISNKLQAKIDSMISQESREAFLIHLADSLSKNPIATSYFIKLDGSTIPLLDSIRKINMKTTPIDSVVSWLSELINDNPPVCDTSIVQCENESGEKCKIIHCETAAEYVSRLRDVYQESLNISPEEERKISKPVGWIIEVAAAGAARFPDGRFTNSYGLRCGVWGVVTYRTDKTNKANFELALMIRYQQSFLDTVASTFDPGFALRWNPYPRFTAYGEIIPRYTSKQNEAAYWNLRANLGVDFEVRDDLRLTFSFGKDYDDQVFEPGGNVMGILGVAYSFFGENKMGLN